MKRFTEATTECCPNCIGELEMDTLLKDCPHCGHKDVVACSMCTIENCKDCVKGSNFIENKFDGVE
jgi:hypothetical protein